MDKREAALLVGRILSRYPAAQTTEGILATWTEEVLARFGAHPESHLRRLAVDYCRRNPGRWPPGLDELCTWIAERLRAEARDRLKLQEPAHWNAEEARRAREMVGRLTAGMKGIG